MKTKINRTKTSLLDYMSIFCFVNRQRGEKLEYIAMVLGKHHSTIIHHLERYVNRLKFDPTFKEKIQNFNEEYFLKKYKETMNLSQILKQPLPIKPVSAQFISVPTTKIKRPLIKPLQEWSKATEYQQLEVQKWLMFCSIAVTMLDTGTKAMAKMKFFSKRNAIFDLIAAFKDLRNAFKNEPKYQEQEFEIDNFIYQFLTGSEEHQKRVIKFQESILNKTK